MSIFINGCGNGGCSLRCSFKCTSSLTFTGTNTATAIDVIANDSQTDFVAYVIGRTTIGNDKAPVTVTGGLNLSNVTLKSHGTNVSDTVYFLKGNDATAQKITTYDGTSVRITKTKFSFDS